MVPLNGQTLRQVVIGATAALLSWLNAGLVIERLQNLGSL